ncbi:MAG: 2OG-Fe(II) oxygenase [Maricaulaceae bacterium]
MIEPGQRLPNFARRDQSGALVMAYEFSCGALIVIVLAETPMSDAATALIKSLEPLHLDGFAGPKVAVMVPGSQDEAQSAAETLGGSLSVWADEDGRVMDFLLGGRIPKAVAAFAFDANFRLIGRFDADGGDDLAAAVTHAWADVNSDQLATIVTAGAPVLIVPRVLEPEDCAAVIELYQAGQPTESGMTRLVDGKPTLVPDPSAKIRQDVEITDEQRTNALMTRIGKRLAPEIQKAFHYTIEQFERFKIVAYDADTGGYFRPHRDNTAPQARLRRFAMTINLNTGDYEGGCLRFPEYGPALYEPPRGGAIVFSCDHAHELTDVSLGRRYALLTFFSQKPPETRPEDG